MSSTFFNQSKSAYTYNFFITYSFLSLSLFFQALAKPKYYS